MKNSISFLKDVRINVAVEHYKKSFLKLTIKVRKKIVADGLDDKSFDVTKKGIHLDAQKFNDLLDDDDTICIDMRNHYESEIGHFRGAITPDVDTFRDSLPLIEKNISEYKENKKLLMYCTGGIRCEKASAYFKHKGFKKVYQLEGGIIEYARQVKEKNLENKNEFLSNYTLMIALYRIGKYDLAKKKLSLIKNKYEKYPFFSELKGDIYYKEGKFNTAINEYEKAIQTLQEVFSPSTDLIKFSLIKTYLQTNNSANLNKSIILLEELLLNNPNWSYLWRLLSKASGKLNKKGMAYIALAEEALIKKNFIKAKKYVDLANKQTSLPISYKLRGSDILNKIKLKYKKN